MAEFLWTTIPPITDPLGQYWDQPPRSAILVDGRHAVMSEATFGQLAEYSASVPTGAYPGKMWKANQRGSPRWWLRWYDTNSDPNLVTISSREILIV